jgi:hypothetical protein
MVNSPVKFVCPVCGTDSSEFVDGLIRRELGQTATPHGVPVPILAAAPRPSAAPAATFIEECSPQPTQAPPPRPGVAVRVHTPPPPSMSATRNAETQSEAPAGVPCVKHLGQLATEKCYICSKPICPKCMELFGYVCSPLCKAKADSHGIQIPVYEGQKSVVEARQWRKVVWASSAIGAVVAAFLGVWFWYAWFGCMPHPVFSVKFGERKYSGQSVLCGKDNQQIVFLHGGTLARYDIPGKKQIWSAKLVDMKQFEKEADADIKSAQESYVRARDHGSQSPPHIPDKEKLMKEMERSAESELTLYVRGDKVWVASPGKLTRYDWDSGKAIKELAVQSRYGGFISRGDELVMIDSPRRRPIVTHINLQTDECRTDDLNGPEATALAAGGTNGPPGPKLPRGTETAGLPLTPGKDMGKPMDAGKIAEQVSHMSTPAKMALPAVLANSMSQERTLAALQDDDTPKADDGFGPSSSFSLIPTKDGFLQFAVKVIEARMVERSAMKPATGKGALEGNVSAGNSLQVAQDLLNEMQRERGGDKVREDESRYQVTIRKPGTQETWTGEVVGPPKLFPLETVNVLTANRQVMVFDKSNKPLWQRPLTHNVVRGLGALDEESATYGQGPCVEHKGTLYVFDEAVLAAFDLKTGNPRWRIPSVGVAGLFFDDKDNIYVNTTTASPDSIKYSKQIDLSDKARNVVLKVDSTNGRILWQVEPGGLVNYVHGKVILVAQSYGLSGPFEDEDGGGPMSGFETPPHLRIRRLNSRNGHEVWEYFQERAPLDIGFDNNTVRLVFKKEVQVLKFTTF